MLKRTISIIAAFSVVLAGGWNLEKHNAKAASISLAGLSYTFSSLSTDTETAGTTTDYTLNKTKYGSKKNGYSFSTGNAKLYASIDGSSKRKLEWSTENYSYSGNKLKQPVMTAGKKNPWKSGTTPYFEVQIATTGYNDITFSAYVGATKKGPKNFAIAYAIGNSGSFHKISGAVLSLSDNKKMEKISASLPVTASNQSLVKIRILVSNLTAINGTMLYNDSTSGEAAINYIGIQGTRISSTNTSSYVVKKVGLNKTKLKLKKGKSAVLKASLTVSPNTSAVIALAKKKLSWSSSNKKVAAVSASGKVKAKKTGTTVVTVKCGSKKAKCKITVS